MDSDLKTALQPFLDGDLHQWEGLPAMTADALTAAYGAPSQIEKTVDLGNSMAERRTYARFAAYVRNGEVVMIEALQPRPNMVRDLGAPTAILPHEILVPGTYVHEYLYAGRGLLLSVAEPFDQTESPRVVRCRAIRPVPDAREVGSDLYLAFEDQTVWS